MATLTVAYVVAGCAATRSVARAGTPPPAAQEPRQVAVRPVAVPAVAPPDPAATPSPTLDQLLAYADRHAPKLVVARQRALRGDAEIEAASPLLPANPEVGAAIGGKTLAASSFLQIETSLSQRLEIAGERGLRIKAAKRGREVARAEVEEVRWQVQVRVRRMFSEALLATARRQLADAAVAFGQEVATIAQRRVDSGGAPPMSLLVVQADLAQAREQQVAARQGEVAARIRLGAACGWPSARPPQPTGALGGVRRAPALPDLQRLALEHQPAVRTAQLALQAAHARVRLEDRDAWPEPTVGVAYSREEDLGPATHTWLFTVGVPLPIWDTNQGGRARARVERGVADAQADALLRTLRARLQEAASAVDAAADRVAIYGTDIVPTAQRNLELVRRAFELGEIDVDRVSLTRERVLASQRQALDAQADYYRAVSELQSLLGTTLPTGESEQRP